MTSPPDPAAAALACTVHAATPRDRAEQARLFNASFKKRIDARGLAWRYDENPHGAALTFVTRPAAGEAVSGYACSPRRAVSFGEESSLALVGETGDVMTHPQWRKRGLFSALDRAAMSAASTAGWPLVFGLPNRRSAHIFLELGWRRVGTVRAHVHVFAADAHARERRGREGRLAGWTCGFAARSARRARARLAATSGAPRFEPLARFPACVADLSRAVERRFALMVRRDAEYLDWRFLRAPSGLHTVLGAHDAAGALAAYVVVQRPRSGEHHGFLVDVLARDEAHERAAVLAGLELLRTAGASWVEATAVDGSWWHARLAEAGFVAPRAANHLTVIVHVHRPDHPLARAADAPATWYLTDGDRDDETMG